MNRRTKFQIECFECFIIESQEVIDYVILVAREKIGCEITETSGSDLKIRVLDMLEFRSPKLLNCL